MLTATHVKTNTVSCPLGGTYTYRHAQILTFTAAGLVNGMSNLATESENSAN